MRVVYLIVILTVSLCAQSILILNSNNKIERYRTMEKSFESAIERPFVQMDICNKSEKEIEEYLYDEYPDIVYTIGTKAYQYAKKYLPEKQIFFSSIMNYKRLNMGKHIYGVSNELHTGMKLTLIKSLLPDTNSVSMVYSRYTKDVYESFKKEAAQFGIKVIGEKIDSGDEINIDMLGKADIFVMIADPLLVKDEGKVKRLYKKLKKKKIPVIAYHPVYLKYGALLVLSVDIPTIGRQVASMVNQEIQGNSFKAIQLPAGSKVIFNQGLAKRMGIHYDKAALNIVNKVIK